LRRPGFGSSRINPARITSPWRSVHYSARIPNHLQNDVLGTALILTNLPVKGVTGIDKTYRKVREFIAKLYRAFWVKNEKSRSSPSLAWRNNQQ
jgi:hypothetical protein